MLFLLSKSLIFCLKPLNWIIGLLAYSLFSKVPLRRRRAGIAALTLLLLATNPWLVNQCMRAWETGGTRLGDVPDGVYETGIVLGGFIDFDADSPEGVVTFMRSGSRLTAAMQLYHAGKIRRILISGGAGRMLGDVPSEAPVARDFLLQNGIPPEAILIEDQSRNTRENARFTRELLDRNTSAGSRQLLITSAWHMRRAHAHFSEAGINCTPFAADFLSEAHRGNIFRWLQPKWETLMKWEFLIKEWVGYLVQQIT